MTAHALVGATGTPLPIGMVNLMGERTLVQVPHSSFTRDRMGDEQALGESPHRGGHMVVYMVR